LYTFWTHCCTVRKCYKLLTSVIQMEMQIIQTVTRLNNEKTSTNNQVFHSKTQLWSKEFLESPFLSFNGTHPIRLMIIHFIASHVQLKLDVI
jgi:hypothetical protein